MFSVSEWSPCTSSEVPSDWKTATISPIFKKVIVVYHKITGLLLLVKSLNISIIMEHLEHNSHSVRVAVHLEHNSHSVAMCCSMGSVVTDPVNHN